MQQNRVKVKDLIKILWLIFVANIISIYRSYCDYFVIILLLWFDCSLISHCGFKYASDSWKYQRFRYHTLVLNWLGKSSEEKWVSSRFGYPTIPSFLLHYQLQKYVFLTLAYTKVNIFMIFSFFKVKVSLEHSNTPTGVKIL